VDNLAHTLVGAALGRAVGARRVPAAGWIGAIAANAPDWAEFLIGVRPDSRSFAYYELHRGVTHSFIGAAIETVGIMAVLLGVFALARRRRGSLAPLGPMTVLVAVCVASHLYLDWQGSYGLRPFLPWSGRWYYADWVAIVDPLYWLLPLVALAWGADRHWRDLIPLVLVAALIAALLVVRADVVTGWLRVTCWAVLAIGAVGWARYWFGPAQRARAAALALLLLALYAGAQAIASVPEKAAVRELARARFGARAQWAALTRVGLPFRWNAMFASPDTVAGSDWAIPRHLDDPRVQRVLREEPTAGTFAEFARFLTAEVDSGPAGVAVTLRDARFALPPARGWGVVTVQLPGLQPRDSASMTRFLPP
jgi:inner membrane protein